MMGVGGDSDHAGDPQLLPQRLFDQMSGLLRFPVVLRLGDGLDHGDVRLVDVDDEVVLLVGEQALDDLDRGAVRALVLADQDHAADLVGNKVKFLGADVHVARQDIVGDDVLDKGGLVVLFLIIVLCLIEGHGGHRADHLRRLIRTLGKGDKLHPSAGGGQGEVGSVCGGIRLRAVFHLVEVKIVKVRANNGKLTAGNDEALIIDHADRSVKGISHLNDDILKNPAGHILSSRIHMANSPYRLNSSERHHTSFLWYFQ